MPDTLTAKLIVPEDEILRPAWHPILPNLTADEVAALAQTAEGRAAYAQWLNARQARIIGADEEEGDPYFHGWGARRGELPHWDRADADLKQAGKGQYVAGGKRATKSERAAWRAVKAAVELPRLKLWCLQGSERTSISEQQSLIWKYLPRAIKALNGKARHGWTKVNYSQDNGFANRILVFPNRSEMHFITYNMDPKEYQGWQLGALLSRELEEKVRRTPDLFNLGAWADEDMPVEWFHTLQLRCTTRNACWMWTFSTLEGITTTIKEITDGAATTASEPAELLPPHQRHVPDCPPGHMPTVQRARQDGISIVYFHSRYNPFPPNYENVRAICAGKPVKITMRDAYGYSEDTRHRAFPKFGPWNIIDEKDLPAEGTNYLVCDPAGSRNWFCVWVRVAPGNPSRFYLYREWPDEGRYGQWAVPSKNPNKFDGDAGPAQKPLGLGYPKLKRTWLELERIHVPAEVKSRVLSLESKVGTAPPGTPDARLETRDARLETLDARLKTVLDPQRRARIVAAIENGEELGELSEEIYARFIDPRAGRDARTAQGDGGTCPIDELAKDGRDESGRIIAPGMPFLPAPGLSREAGIQAVNDLLDWNEYEPLQPILNEPRLYVVRGCGNVIWMFNNNTATGGEDAACKDPEDVCRYLATAGLAYIDPSLPVGRGQGAY